MVSPEDTMSFENAFEKWLSSLHGRATMEDDNLVTMACDSDYNDAGTQSSEVTKEVGAGMEVSGGESDGDCEAGMPVIERMAWQEEDLKGMPVLQRMVDIPSKRGVQAAQSPPPPPLQISLSLKRCSTQGKCGKKSKSDIFRVESHVQEKSERGLNYRDKYASRDTFDEKLQKTSESISKAHQHYKVKKRHKKRSKSPRHSSTRKRSLSGTDIKAVEGGTQKSLSVLTAFEPSYSPGPGGDVTSHTSQHPHGVKQKDCASVHLDEAGSGDAESSVVRRTSVLSPDRGTVEPDSTSEISGSGSKPSSQHTDSNMDVDKGRSCSATFRSAGCVHIGRGGDVSVRVEEGLGECDSTSMFLVSPNAISPASQGEIEERLCPVLTDHEDSGHHVSRWSPGHCICQCRSFPSPTDLITPTTNTTTGSSSSSSSESPMSLVREKNGVCCQAAPCLEKMTLGDDVSPEACVREEGRTVSPPVLSPTELENGASCEPAKGKDRQYGSDHHQCVSDPDRQETPPPLTHYQTVGKDNGSEDRRSPNLSESPPVLTLPEHADRVFADTVRTVPEHADRGFADAVRSDHHSREKVSKDRIDHFSPDIKWESAVATVETKPSPNRGGIDDGKPGIVIKIRTKAATKTTPTFLLSVPDTDTRVEPAHLEFVPLTETLSSVHSLTLPMAETKASPVHSLSVTKSEKKASSVHSLAVSKDEIKASSTHLLAVSKAVKKASSHSRSASKDEIKASSAHLRTASKAEKKAPLAHPNTASKDEIKASLAHSPTASKDQSTASSAHLRTASKAASKSSLVHSHTVPKSERKPSPAHSRIASKAAGKASLHLLKVSEAKSKALPHALTVANADIKASLLYSLSVAIPETKVAPAHSLTVLRGDSKASPDVPETEASVAPSCLLAVPEEELSGEAEANVAAPCLLTVPEAEASLAAPCLLTVPEAEANVAAPCLLTVPEEGLSGVPRESRQPMSVRRKRHTIDSPEMARRLRKRRKTSNEEKEETGENKSDGDVRHSASCLAQNKRLRPGQTFSCQCCSDICLQRGRCRRNTVHLGSDLTASVAHLPPAQRHFVLSSARLSRLQTRTHMLLCTLFPRLSPLLVNVAPESLHFEKTIDDIVGSLQRSEMEEMTKDSEELSHLLGELTLGDTDCVPVFSPRVVLCRSPGHALETFQDKVCAMLQLLLPDITVSLTNNAFHNSQELEVMIDRVITANKGKVAKKSE